ncbi:unnamed protein product [Timema podura]|uniref:Uncharacterized protein n=1 Tax=Timema podura TaxID=61482 RepID=A0ABN7NZ86_TIMPD|nr:unnamed protein product [Timema podura]
MLSMEDIVLHMEKEDIALHMEEVGNVKPRIVLNMLRKEDIVWHMEEEESNTAANFNDTINYETECFQTPNVKMKSMWDGFLPIKEQIKLKCRMHMEIEPWIFSLA